MDLTIYDGILRLFFDIIVPSQEYDLEWCLVGITLKCSPTQLEGLLECIIFAAADPNEFGIELRKVLLGHEYPHIGLPNLVCERSFNDTQLIHSWP